MRLTGTKLVVACFLAGLLVVALGTVFRAGTGGSFLLALIFWVSLTQGCIALAAAAELSNAKWILPLRRGLLSVHPLLLFFSLLFLFVWTKMEMYPWTAAPTAWMGTGFFVSRNFILLLITFLLARKFSSECLDEGPRAHLYAVLYLFAFVISQSLIAFDWVMSLEYPWFSTLFGGYFFIEAFYGAIAISVIISIFHGAGSGEGAGSLRDAAKMLFGFSLFWAGLFYAQYLVIWYGNLPEELGYLLKRIHPPYFYLSRAVLLLLFIIPFLVLLSKKAKTNRAVMMGLSLCVAAGILFERVLFLAPAVDIHVSAAVAQFIVLGFLFFAAVAASRPGRPGN